jgi:phosphoenolpyruvate carboxykinase (GTP)
MCGKTSTAMLNGETIVGDDLAYIREFQGKAYAANVERGIFGIIKDVNRKDDPVLFDALINADEVIFSNILVDDTNNPYWLGNGSILPHKGVNFSGEWFPGKTDEDGTEVPLSHKNARYTIGLKALENCDPVLEDPQGVEVRALIYGGRDSDTSCPVQEALSWHHGIVAGACSIESETTAATLGQEGVRVFNPMSNIDFLSIPLGRYIEMNLQFKDKLKSAPRIFSVNYFLKNKQGKFLNEVIDKKVWLRWIRERIDSNVKAFVTPTGLIPEYDDLAALSKDLLKRDYPKENYFEQFTLRIPENLAKIERIVNIYHGLKSIPREVFDELKSQEERLKAVQAQFGDYVTPDKFTQKA